MTINLLDYFLITQIMAFFMIFVRIGSALMLMPGFGEVYVSPRIRLLFALVFSLMLTPMLEPRMPILPTNGFELGVLVAGEVLVGTFLGLIVRVMLSAVHVAGTIIAMQSSLAVAAIFDPSSGGQAPVVSNILTLMAITLFFTLNLHHLMLAALMQSYDVFPPAAFPSVSDMNLLHVRLMADSFTLGVMLAGPHIIFSLLFYLAGGLANRLMPSFQVFFVLMPVQILLALFLLIATLPILIDIFMGFMENQIHDFVTVG